MKIFGKEISKKKLVLLALITLLAVIMAGVVWWRMRPLSNEEVSATDAVVEREDCYMLCTDRDTLLVFSAMEGDSLMEGVSLSADSVARRVTRVPAQWVNRVPVIPSCHGRLMLCATDTSDICKAGATKIRHLLSAQSKYIDQCLATIAEQQEQTDYYLRTHNVTEMGFDVVARMHSHLTYVADSLKRISDRIASIGPNEALKMTYHARYFAYVASDSDTIRTECVAVDRLRGMLMVRTKGNSTPVNLQTRVNVYDDNIVRDRIARRGRPLRVLPDDMAIDSAGVYRGEIDSIGNHHGYGKLTAHDMSYYEGEWEHGVRQGFGLALTPGKRLRIGEWKDDTYLGERITYTDERIYGIDISRYQHEKGKKRFKIDWSNLAITSLGHISKKTINGQVNYPISFIYIKCTEGTSVFNKYFYADYRAARQHGYKVGAYHFFSTRSSGAKQALFFLKKSRYQRGDFPPVLDVEPSPKQIAQMGGTAAMMAHIRKWLSMVEQAWGVRPVLYVSQTFVNRYLPAAPDLMKNYNVWIARYGEYKPDVNLIYWQLCPDGRVRGIRTEVDINVFNGFESEWQNFLGKLR